MALVVFLILTCLPGAWVTFSLRLPGYSAGLRLLIGAALAPAVVCLQFYFLRFLGVEFERTVRLLIGANLPALYLVVRHRNELTVPHRETVVTTLCLLLFVFACCAPQLIDAEGRMFTGHAWMHADIVYLIANGQLRPEEPDLAGIALAYPWAGHVYQAVLSYALGSPPVSSYIWTNLFCLLTIGALAATVAGELGGGRFAKATSVIWLLFGVNFLGYLLQHVLPVSIMRTLALWVDYRFTPWALKFLFFNPIPIALALFSAVVLLCIRAWPAPLGRSSLVLLALLLSALGIFYPFPFPPACAVVGGRALALVLDPAARRSSGRREIVLLAVVILGASAVTLLHSTLIAQARATSAVHFSQATALLRKVVDSLIVTFPLTAGFAATLPSLWKERRGSLIILGAGALASCICYAGLRLPPLATPNEYKFIFTAAICLAPFPALALEPVWTRLGRGRMLVAAVGCVILAVPLVDKTYTDRAGWMHRERPRVDASSFALRLADGERWAPVCDVIRQQTPSDAIVVVQEPPLHLPTLTQRALFVPPVKNHPGMNIGNDHLLHNVRGHDVRLLENRRTTLAALYGAADENDRIHALDRLTGFGRPLAVVLEPDHSSLRQSLARRENALPLYDAKDLAVWLVR